MDFKRLFEILEYQAARYPQEAALSGISEGQWTSWSTRQFLQERDRLSAGLLRAGFRSGERIGILSHCSSPEWVLADAALMQIGLIPVPLHATARADEIRFIVQDADMRACFVSNADMLAKLQSAGPPQQIFGLQDIPGLQSWQDIAVDPEERDLQKIRYLREGIAENELATLLYTSGTTGLPKGVMLSHHNIVSNVKSVLAIVPVGPGIVALSYLPMSHILERMVTYVYQAAGASVWFADRIDTLPELLKTVRPHFFSAVPRILERSYERLLEERSQSGRLKRAIMDWAIALGERFPYAGGHAMPLVYRIKRWLADWLVYRHWRSRLGGRVQAIAVGAAALRPSLGRLFSAAGIDVREGYGLTETSPVIAFNRFDPGGVRFGTVGMAAPGVDIRIAPGIEGGQDGEIEVRGPGVMMGYWNRPEESAQRFTPDGWFKTGDTGQIVHKKFLKITGRISELFKTSSGKFVAPAYVEEQLNYSPFISQSMVFGLNKPYAAALIVPDFIQLESWCRDHNVHWTSAPFMILNPKVEKLFRDELARINQLALSDVEQIRQFKLLHEPWSTENGLLTPTLKLRRGELNKVFEQEIAELFESPLQS